MPERPALRVVDFGTVSPLRSQTLWHAVAYGVGAGAPPTLSFVRTRSPYVSIGFHRSLDELDTDRCGHAGWPVYRRMVGGGPVYLDHDQLCFQLTLPAAAVPADRQRALRQLLTPAVAAFRAAGLDAHLDHDLEVVVGDRKVCGHGAAQIGSSVVVVGNLIERFDHTAAASVLRAPDADEAGETLRLMRRYVAFDGSGPDVDAAAFADAACRAYGAALGLAPRPGALSALEAAQLVGLDRRLRDPAWTRGRPRLAGPAGTAPVGTAPVGTAPTGTAPAGTAPVWKVKVRAGVWRCSVLEPAGKVAASVVHGRVQRLVVQADGVDPARAAAAAEGLTVAAAADAARRWGPAGPAVAGALRQIQQEAA